MGFSDSSVLQNTHQRIHGHKDYRMSDYVGRLRAWPQDASIASRDLVVLLQICSKKHCCWGESAEMWLSRYSACLP